MRKLIEKWKTTIILGILILVVAMGFRVFNLTGLPVFGDEAIYLRWAQVMRAEPTLRFLPLSDGKQPLFMWTVIPFFKIFADPLFAGRMVSALAGIATTVGVFGLSYILSNSKKAALVAAVLYGLSPFSVFFDRLALADSMLNAFAVWTLFFAVLSAKTLRLDFAMIAGFCLGGALLTKSPALYCALLLPTAWLFASFSKNKKGRILTLVKLLSLTLVTLFIGYGMYNILRLGPNFHMIGIRNQDYVYPLTQIITSPFKPLIHNLKQIVNFFWLLGPGLFISLYILGLFIGLRRNLKVALVLAAWSLVPIFAAAEFSKTMTARYVFLAVPFAAATISLVFLENQKTVQKLFGILLAFSLIHSLMVNFRLITNPELAPLPRSERSGFLEEWTSGYGIKEVGEILRGVHQSQNRQIIVGTEGFFGTLPDGLQMYLNDILDIKVIGVGVIIKDLPTPLIEAKKAGNPTYFVINSTRYIGDPDAQGLRLLASYPKAPRSNGTQESLLFYELTQDSIPEEELE
jgi:4-amino-4-deoxy-L-arabinose transferase-like glycosyltransferase